MYGVESSSSSLLPVFGNVYFSSWTVVRQMKCPDRAVFRMGLFRDVFKGLSIHWVDCLLSEHEFISLM